MHESRSIDLRTILQRMEHEANILGANARSIAWSTDVIGFLRGAAGEPELGLHDLADALRMTLRVWLAGSASNHSIGPP